MGMLKITKEINCGESVVQRVVAMKEVVYLSKTVLRLLYNQFTGLNRKTC